MIFVSYAHQDAALLGTFVASPLTKAGVEYWTDEGLNTLENDHWWAEVSSRISTCTAFVFLLTEDWQQSDECERELLTAQSAERPIVPIQPYEFDLVAKYAYLPKRYQISKVYQRDGRDLLAARLSEFRPTSTATAEDEGSPPPVDLHEVLDRIAEQNGSIRVLGRGSPHGINDLVVPLTIRHVREPASRGVPLTSLLDGGIRHAIVVGGPGSGKSTSLQYLQVLASRDPYELLTIRVGCRALAARRTMLKAWVQSFARANFGLDLEAPGARVVLLLDGLDEVEDDEYSSFVKGILELIDELPTVQVIISSRANGVESVPELGELDQFLLLELSQSDVIQYVDSALDSKNRDRLLEVLRSNERIAELARTPFVLALIVATHPDLGEHIRHRAALFETAVTFLLRGDDWEPTRKRPSKADVELHYQILKRLALRLFMLESTSVFSTEEVLHSVSTNEGVANPEETLREIVETSGLLQVDRGGYYFVHKTIWEYLVASACRDEPEAAIVSRALSPRWEEPIRLFIGLIDEDRRSRVLEEIWTLNPLLSLRAMTEASEFPLTMLEELYGSASHSARLGIVRDLAQLRGRLGSEAAFIRAVVDTGSVISRVEMSAEILWELIIQLRAIDSAESLAIVETVLDSQHANERLRQLLAALDGRGAFVEINGGLFDMGLDIDRAGSPSDPTERPQHSVQVSSFAMLNLLVTNGPFYAMFPYCNDHRGEYSSESDQPVNNVTWFEAQMFAWWVGCDLPTEAEWEFAARGRPSDDEALSDLEQVPMYAWYGENSENRTHPVGLRSPNSRGLYDLLGNLREWCGDWYSETYYAECLESGDPVIDPGGPESGERRVLRGGTFDWAKWNLRPTYRNFNTPDNRSHVTGFRLVVRAGLSGWAELSRPPS